MQVCADWNNDGPRNTHSASLPAPVAVATVGTDVYSFVGDINRFLLLWTIVNKNNQSNAIIHFVAIRFGRGNGNLFKCNTPIVD